MFLGALLDAGLEIPRLEAELVRLAPEGVCISASTVMRAGLRGTRARVSRGAPETPGSTESCPGHCGDDERRDLAGILRSIAGAGFSSRVSDQAARVFGALASAEAEAHGCPVDEVVFHEVGAPDAILEIVGTLIGFELLGVSEIWCPGLATGWGTVRCSHGEIPVPAPATAVMLRGIPVVSGHSRSELTTPTGAALLVTLVDHWTAPPPAKWDGIGLGAGAADLSSPNLLRIRLGSPGIPVCPRTDEALELVTLLDDMDPRLFPKLQEAVLSAGALDCYAAHCTGRKGRPAIEVTVICRGDTLDASLDALLRNSTTIGVRIRSVGRRTLDRDFIEVTTPWGPARLKAAVVGRRYVNVNPEFADCEDLARKAGLPVRVVLDRLKAMASELEGCEGGADAPDS